MAKIMIVDDAIVIRSQVRRALEETGHSVIEAGDGSDGFDKIVACENLDLVVVDFHMPGMDGLSMVQKVNERLGFKVVQFLMLTADISEDVRQRGKAAGVIGWINKPFNKDLFNAAVQKILSQKPSR